LRAMVLPFCWVLVGVLAGCMPEKTPSPPEAGIDQLKQNMGDLTETARSRFQESIRDLDQKLEGAEQRLARLREAGSDAWTEADDDLQGAVEDLEAAYRDASDALNHVT